MIGVTPLISKPGFFIWLLTLEMTHYVKLSDPSSQELREYPGALDASHVGGSA
jgi:hypothetical protein